MNKTTGLSAKTTYLREIGGVPAVTALLLSEKENFCCRVGPVDIKLGKSRI